MASSSRPIDDPILNLIQFPFWDRDAITQRKIIQVGRPPLDVARFGSDVKSKSSEWLTGSSRLGKVFCWPCLLFFRQPYVWNKTGFCDFKNLAQAQNRHERTTVHIGSSIVLKIIEKKVENEVRSKKGFEPPAPVPTGPKTEIVQVLKRGIDVICTFFTKNYRTDFSPSIFTVYKDALHFLQEYDIPTEEHFSSSEPNKISTVPTFNRLINAIVQVMKDEIRKEIALTRYVSVILNAHCQSSSSALMATTVRYVTDNDVVERFLGFKRLGDKRTASSVVEEASVLIKEMKAKRKVVAYSFDGSIVPHAQIPFLKHSVEVKGRIHVSHCYSHDLSEILLQSLRDVQEYDSFLKDMAALATFYEVPEIRGLYCYFMKDELKIQNGGWNADFRSIPLIKEFRNTILRFLNWISSQHERLDPQNIVKALGFHECLKQLKTVVMLEILSNLIACTQFLSNLFKRKEIPIKLCVEEISRLEGYLMGNLHTGFDPLWENSLKAMYDLERPQKKRRVSDEEKLHMKQVYTDILRRFWLQIECRLGNLDKFDFLALLTCKNYESFKTSFPEIALDKLSEQCGMTLDMELLKSELLVMYAHPDFSDKDSDALLHFIRENKIEEEFKEITKLAEILLTLPITAPPTTCVDGGLFSLVASYSETNTPEECCSNLALLAIESDLLFNLREKTEFYSQVISRFNAEETGT